MNDHKKQICQTILKETVSIGGFVIELRSGEFLHKNFEVLISAIEEFKSINYGEDKIELEIVFCLYTLVDAIGMALPHAHNRDERKILEEALAKSYELLLDITWPDYLRDLKVIEEKWGIQL